MIILFLLLSPFLCQLMPGFTLSSFLELMPLLFLHGSLFVPFLFPDLVEGGLSGFFFFLTGCNLNLYIAH